MGTLRFMLSSTVLVDVVISHAYQRTNVENLVKPQKGMFRTKIYFTIYTKSTISFSKPYNEHKYKLVLQSEKLAYYWMNVYLNTYFEEPGV